MHLNGQHLGAWAFKSSDAGSPTVSGVCGNFLRVDSIYMELER